MITYVMTCGCKWQKEELVRSIGGTNINNCPNHPGENISHRVLVCPDCGKREIIPSKGNFRSRCKKCAARRIKESQKRSKSNKGMTGQYILASNQRRAAKAAYDCAHRDECLAECFVRNPKAEYLEGCYQCTRYLPVDVSGSPLAAIRVHGGYYDRRVSV